MAKEKTIEEVFVISGHIFQDVISIIFTSNINDSITWQCKHKKISPAKFIADKDKINAIVCYVDDGDLQETWVLFDINKINTGIIVHEVTHVVHDILSKRDIKLSHKTEEVFAYTNEWFFNKINDFWTELKANLKTND